jgi:DNA-binding response OmpR family regulator
MTGAPVSAPATNPTWARVVLVEDDPSIQNFVAMALEDLPLTLQACGNLAQARRALAPSSAACALLLTDLMLPDGCGLDLLEEIQAGPAALRPSRIAVFSAGVTGPVRERLYALGVDTVMSKPVALAELQACVRLAIENASAGSPRAVTSSDASNESAAIDEFFAGDATLFRGYRDSCLLQFDADLRVGDAAVQAGDLQALRRLAHSLKTVLRMLGHPELSAQAAELENRSAASHPDAFTRWPSLREDLLALHAGGSHLQTARQKPKSR